MPGGEGGECLPAFRRAVVDAAQRGSAVPTLGSGRLSYSRYHRTSGTSGLGWPAKARRCGSRVHPHHDRHNYFDFNEDSHRYNHSHRYALRHFRGSCCWRRRDQYANLYCSAANRHGHIDRHSHRHRDIDGYQPAHLDGDSDRHYHVPAHLDGDSDPYHYSDCHRDAHGHDLPNGDAHANTHGDCYSHSYEYPHADAMHCECTVGHRLRPDA